MESASKTDESLTAKLDISNDSIFSLETQILDVKTKGGAASELGPLKYLSGLTGISMDRIINWLLLIIVFVFDPLALSLVIAANFAFSQIKNPFKENIYGEIIPNELESLENDAWNPTTEEYENYINDIMPSLSEEDKKYDLNNDGVLDVNEQRIKEDVLLNSPAVSAWRKRKILEQREKNGDDLTITY